jgi:hypothetical protein
VAATGRALSISRQAALKNGIAENAWNDFDLAE